MCVPVHVLDATYRYHGRLYYAPSFLRSPGKHIAGGEWKADRWSRGGVVTYQGEKQCPWKRRMTKDGAHFARIIHTTKGFVIQKGMVALSDENDEEVQLPAGIDVTDMVTNDGAGTSVDDAKKSAKRKAKEKEEVFRHFPPLVLWVRRWRLGMECVSRPALKPRRPTLWKMETRTACTRK